MKKPLWSSLSLAIGVLAVARVGSAQVDPAPTASESAGAPGTSSDPSTTSTGSGAQSTGSQNGRDSNNSGGPVGSSGPGGAAADSDEEEEDARGSDGEDPPGKDSKGKKAKKKKGDKSGKDDKDDKDNEDAVLPWEAKPKVKIGGLINAEFSINDAPEIPNYDFRLNNARIYLSWQQGSWLDAQAEIELSRDRDRKASSWAPMRDAYVRVSPDRAFRMRMGQFKRPFGGLQLISLKELKLIRRGISDTWINEELNYGERDAGFQLEGKFGKWFGLSYAVGVFNGSGRNRRDLDPNGTKDLVGRVEAHLGKTLRVAYNVANKRFDQSYPDYARYPSSTWMSGADVLVEAGGFYGYVEGQYGTNYQSIDQYHTASALALLAYRIPITPFWKLALEPLVKGEVLRVETEVRDRQIFNGTAGANLYVGDIFRLMIQGEWISTKGVIPENLAEARPEKCLIVQGSMFTR
ncbi:MAG TPA: porin [Polyangiaceae bacterium]|nr:porin [Polyangiaceae bacterium]